RVVEWFFDDINLPDSTSDEAGSHGFVKFRIRPLQPLMAGTVIENTANIYFDYNEPVITEPSVLVAELSTGVDHSSMNTDLQVNLYPNPASDGVIVNVENGAIAELVLCAADGRVVLLHRGGASRLELDLGPLPSGIFTVQLKLDDGTVRNLKLAKH
ncbi:MAG: T9SS type A sorting domain-containing protein, partial [Candidatus Promineifilaceae bacterium]